jgi:hypothetical protein
MENVNETSPAATQPRSPNDEELQLLAGWLLGQGFIDQEDAIGTARSAYVAVYDAYCTGCPGYAGKLMSVVWDGAPSFFDVFIWNNGKMERSGRDYDQHECCLCGSTDGTLCRHCWRTHGTATRPKPNPDLESLVREADDAFWAVIARRFPAAISGDLSPERTVALSTAAEQAVSEWIENNVNTQHGDGPTQ